MSEIDTRLFLITPPLDDVEAFAPRLEAAFAGGRIDSLWLRLAGTDERLLKTAMQRLAPIAQNAGAAVLIDPPPDPRLIARCGADGVHMRYDEAALAEAVETHRQQRIVGVGGLRSRDEAMLAGEAGADYLMFGEPYPDGALPPFERVLERADWWAEIFATPCIAYAPTLAEVAPLARIHVEFVALGDAVWSVPDPAEAIREALALIAAEAVG